MRPTIKIILIINLTILAVLVFVYPHLMVSPGKLIDDHKISETDCFACHDVLLGASSEKCITCHKVADIGLLTTKGTPKIGKKPNVAFHQKLLGQDCVACHSDHEGVAIYRKKNKFSHQLLDTALREQCIACHKKPEDEKHRQASDKCTQCHSSEKWKPATFDHKLLKKSELDQCTNCHKAKVPSDKLHQQASDKCGQCHSTDKWKPATFDHAQWFRFDDEHERCTTCHRTPTYKEPNYKEYTCYFCHEHTPEKIRREHVEEGIRDFDNCVSCHRSSDEDAAKRAWETIKRGLPYQFNQSSSNSKRRKEKNHEEDD
jgi:class III cytochrome C family protein